MSDRAGEKADSVLFIGLGRMGGPMALRLHEAGVALAVVDVLPEALHSFSRLGTPVATSAVDLPGDVVITMLPTAAHVRTALLGPEGVCQRRALPRAVIDMSSATPGDTVTLGRDLEALNVALLDAPVSGGTAGAIDGSLTAMVGGDLATFERYAPLIGHMCRTVRHVGPLGSGHTLKALNNYLSAVTLWTASEALLIGAKLGLDPRAMLEVWSLGSGRSHAVDVKLPRHVLPRSFDFGQSLELFCKDIGIARDLAVAAGVPAPALAGTTLHWNKSRDRLGGAADITAILRLLEADAGFEVNGGKPV